MQSYKLLVSAILFLIGFHFSSIEISAQNMFTLVEAQVQIDGQVYTVDWSSDGQYLAIASLEGLSIYDKNLNELATLFDGELMYSVHWHPSLSRLAITIGNNLEVWDWDSRTNTLIQVAEITRNRVQVFVEWNLDGSLVASVEVDTSIYQSSGAIAHIMFWDGNTFSQKSVVQDLYQLILDRPIAGVFAWSPNQANLFAGIGNRIKLLPDGGIMAETNVIVYAIDAKTGNRFRDIGFPYDILGYSLAWQANSNYIAIGDEYGVGIFDFCSSEQIAAIGENGFDFFAVSWTADGRYIVTNSSLFDSETFEHVGDFGSEGGTIVTVAWNPDSIHLAIGTEDGYVSIQNASAIEDTENHSSTDSAIPSFEVMPNPCS